MNFNTKETLIGLHITDLDDTYIAKSKFEAVKAFLVKHKGKYLIHSVFEV